MSYPRKLYYLEELGNNGSIYESYIKYQVNKRKNSIMGTCFDCFSISQLAKIATTHSFFLNILIIVTRSIAISFNKQSVSISYPDKPSTLRIWISMEFSRISLENWGRRLKRGWPIKKKNYSITPYLNKFVLVTNNKCW